MQFVAMAIKSAESAKRILATEAGLNAEQIRYLRGVIRQGENAQGIMNEWERAREKARKEGRLIEHESPLDKYTNGDE